MLDFIKKAEKIYKTNIKRPCKKYINGRKLSKSELSPEVFVNEYFIPKIHKQELPKHMENKDVFRRQDPKTAIEDLHQEIITRYHAKQSGFLPYDEETPYNKMLLWGIMFAVLYKIFVKNPLQKNNDKKYITIGTKQYNAVPSRYHGIFTKTSGNTHTYIDDKSNAKYHVLHTFESKENLYTIQKQIQTALPLIYKKKLVKMAPKFIKEHHDFAPDGTEFCWHEIATIKTHGQFANTDRMKSKFVSDGQMESIEQLKIIFENIASECLILKPKHGAREIYYEYMDENTRKQIVTKAQKLTRTANQMIVSTRKAEDFCDLTQMHLAEDYNKKARRHVLYQLKQKISIKIK